MLVARRDPPFHVDAHDAAPAGSSDYSATRVSRFAGFMTALQVIGSLLAVPVGIASAYSFYLANFSPETTCQSLRSGIVAMLDKNVDAATRRMLVRRDVETFKKTCGAVDPDATAAFKGLLAVEKTAVPAVSPAVPVAPKVQHSESAPKEPVRKAEPRLQTIKQPVTSAAPAALDGSRRDPADSDAQWLEAVRQALVTHKPESHPADAAKPQPAVPAAQPARQETTLPMPAATPAPAMPARVPVAPSVAPALPPPVTIAPPPSQRVDADHPVPPGSIPDVVLQADTAKPEEQDRSRIGKWISAIPLLGTAVDYVRR
jgi:hypothetical protein